MCKLHIHGGKVEMMLTPHLEEFDAEALFFRNLTYERPEFGGWALLKRLLKLGGGFVADVPALLDRGTAPTGVALWRL